MKEFWIGANVTAQNEGEESSPATVDAAILDEKQLFYLRKSWLYKCWDWLLLRAENLINVTTKARYSIEVRILQQEAANFVINFRFSK